MQAVDYAEIAGDLDRLAVGGEGIVYRLRSRPTLVFKEYKEAQRPTLNVRALVGLVESVASMEPADRQRISTRTVWPKHLVVRNGQVQGFLMPSVDDAFYRRYGLRANPRLVLCDWNQLTYHHPGSTMQPHMLSEIPMASHGDRLRLVSDLAETLEVLHRGEMVVGDMSGKNLLWTLAPTRVVLIDCDSFRRVGHPAACGHKESPGWVDPSLAGAPTTQQSDIFKLGVAAYRALVADPSGVLTPDLVRNSSLASVAAGIVQLVAASVDHPGSRPTAAEWVSTIEDLTRFEGRPRIAAPVTAPHGVARPSRASSVPGVRPRSGGE